MLQCSFKALTKPVDRLISRCSTRSLSFCQRGLLCVGMLCFLSSAAYPQDAKPALEMLLSAPVMTPQTSLAEAQDYCEARVPPLPQVKTAEEWEQRVNKMRADTLQRVVYRGEAATWRDAKCQVEWLDTIPGGPGYSIRKLRYEALPGLWIPAVLYIPEKLTGKVPVAMNVNGHDRIGKAADYKQIRCINQVKRGMLVLNPEWLGMGQLSYLQHSYMNQLDLCGTSGLAPFYLSLKRGLDILLAHENADPSRVVVAGLSGGGWQTIIISALDTRVTLANPVAGYSSFKTRIRNFRDLGDSEQTPTDLATSADYLQLTAMRAPRPTLLTFNATDDCCFQSGHALPPLLEGASPIFKLYDKELNLRSHINTDPGTHNFLKDNRQALYKMMGEHFFPNDPQYKAEEIPSDSEVKTLDELKVEIPETNARFQTLALALSAKLPRSPELPANKEAAVAWKSERRDKLRQILRYKPYVVDPERVGVDKQGEIQAVRWKLKLVPDGQGVPAASEWTVPVTELTRGTPQGTVLLIADKGRAALAAEVEKLLANGQRVLAVDPLEFGEAKFASHGYLFGLLISAVGERTLGIQVAQLGAVARWAQTEYKTSAIGISAYGQRTSTLALVTAGLDEHSLQRVELHGGFGSLKEILEQNEAVTGMHEHFCFGLLEEFDIRQLAALAAPRLAEFHESTERQKAELAPLKAYYEKLGVQFEPLR